MPVIFKVVETYILPNGSQLDALRDAIELAGDVPFCLEEEVILSQTAKFVKLTRVATVEDTAEQGEDVGAESEEAEIEARPSTSSQDDAWQEQTWQGSGWQDRSQPDSQWQEDTEWQGGNPCHVCGKVRAEHPGKKFCTVPYGHKRTRL